MILYFDRDLKRFVSSPGYRDRVSRVEFKRGDAARIEVVFIRGTERELLGGTNEIRFGIKEMDKYDGDPLVFLDSWTEGVDSYTGEPDFNTTALNDLLVLDDDDSNDMAYVDAMLEVTFTEDGGTSWTSSDTLTARIYNDVVRGDEGVPTSGSPAYLSAAEVARVAKGYRQTLVIDDESPVQLDDSHLGSLLNLAEDADIDIIGVMGSEGGFIDVWAGESGNAMAVSSAIFIVDVSGKLNDETGFMDVSGGSIDLPEEGFVRLTYMGLVPGGRSWLYQEISSPPAVAEDEPVYAPSSLRFTGAMGNNASVPYEAAFAARDVVDVAAHVMFDDVTPAADQWFVANYLDTGNQRSWGLKLKTTGKVVWQISTNGSTSVAYESTVSPTVVNGAFIWLRAKYDYPNREVTFYTKVNEADAWVQLGAAVTVSDTQMRAPSAHVEIGGLYYGSAVQLKGAVKRVVMNDGTSDTLDVSFDHVPTESLTVEAATGQTCTIEQGGVDGVRAEIIRDNLRVAAFNVYEGVGSVASDKNNAIIAIINRMHAHFVVITELKPDFTTGFNALAAATGYGYAYIADSAKDYRIGILSKYAMTTETIVSKKSNFWDTLIGKVDFEGFKFALLGIHGNHDANAATKAADRVASWFQLESAAAKLADEGYKMALAGDWNWTPNEAADAAGEANPAAQAAHMGFTYEAHENLAADDVTMWEVTPNPAVLLGTAEPLDRIVCKGFSSMAGQIIDSEVTQSGGLPMYGAELSAGHSRDASDHKPVVSVLTE